MRGNYIQTVAIVLLLAVVLVLAWQKNSEIGETSQLARKVDELNSKTSKLADQSTLDTAALTEKCAGQAVKLFHQLGYKDDSPDVYQNHYNTKLHRCFMTIESSSVTKGTPIVSKMLLDAYEQRGYANYMWSNRDGKFYADVPPTICELTPASGDEKNCHSEAEYRAFVARYME